MWTFKSLKNGQYFTGDVNSYRQAFENTAKPDDRDALLNECNGRINDWTSEIQRHQQYIGNHTIYGHKIDDELRSFWFAKWMLNQWEQLYRLARDVPYVGEAYEKVLPFKCKSHQELVALAQPYVSEMLAEFKSSYFDESKLIAKLTEGTDKIGFESTKMMHGQIIQIVLRPIQPSKLKRLAICAEAAPHVRIHDLRIGTWIVISDVSAEAYTDPGSLIPDPAGANNLYPGLPVVLTVENMSLDELQFDAWLGVETVKFPF